MISTKMSPERAKDYTDGPGVVADTPTYSYGTCLCLDTEMLKRLGMTNLPELGAEFTLHARVVVTSVRSNQEQGGEKRLGADLQITEMELGAPQADRPNTASVLYGGG